ncbi:MAG: hypothetical protein AAFY15_02295 [Cyanobacteria bacterium J06648_11]
MMRSTTESKRGISACVGAIAITVLVWLGACALVDGVMMPTMSTSGMAAQAGFAAAGYQFFSTFNQLELLAGAIALTGALAAWKHHIFRGGAAVWGLTLASILPIVAGVDTVLTPHISGLALDLDMLPSTANVAAPLSADMMLLQETYWGVEVVKLAIAVGLLVLCWKTTIQPSDRLTD